LDEFNLYERTLRESKTPAGYEPEKAFGREAKDKKHLATIDEACPKCQYPTMAYYTMQLRSVDEGQTIFYNCLNCGHAYAENS